MNRSADAIINSRGVEKDSLLVTTSAPRVALARDYATARPILSQMWFQGKVPSNVLTWSNLMQVPKFENLGKLYWDQCGFVKSESYGFYYMKGVAMVAKFGDMYFDFAARTKILANAIELVMESGELHYDSEVDKNGFARGFYVTGFKSVANYSSALSSVNLRTGKMEDVLKAIEESEVNDLLECMAMIPLQMLIQTSDYRQVAGKPLENGGNIAKSMQRKIILLGHQLVLLAKAVSNFAGLDLDLGKGYTPSRVFGPGKVWWKCYQRLHSFVRDIKRNSRPQTPRKGGIRFYKDQDEELITEMELDDEVLKGFGFSAGVDIKNQNDSEDILSELGFGSAKRSTNATAKKTISRSVEDSRKSDKTETGNPSTSSKVEKKSRAIVNPVENLVVLGNAEEGYYVFLVNAEAKGNKFSLGIEEDIKGKVKYAHTEHASELESVLKSKSFKNYDELVKDLMAVKVPDTLQEYDAVIARFAKEAKSRKEEFKSVLKKAFESDIQEEN